MGTRLEEWDLDDALHFAIKNHPKFTFETVIAAFEKYDSFYSIAKELKLKLDPKFGRFYRITKG